MAKPKKTDVTLVRILCMEDDPGLSQLLQRRLLRQGYSVDIAANGEEGLALIRKAAYDLLIVDYNMPFLGGMDVIRALAAENRLFPTIMVTGEGSEAVAVEAIKLGAADYIVKDVELRFLELIPSVIHQVLYRQQLIREHERLEEQVRRNEERYRHLFENNPHPMWVFDVQTLSFLAVNDAAVRHYGFSREEFLAMKLRDIRPSEDLPQFLEAARGLGSEAMRSGVWRHRKKDGSIIDVEIVSHPILFGDRQARFSLITDITARRKIEEELQKSQKLESLGVLAGGLAHDFNNLLTAIIGNIGLAKVDAPGESAVYARLCEAERATEKARALSQQLLTFARGGAPVKKMLSVGETVRNMASLSLRGSNCKAEFAIPGGLWQAEADEAQLNQVINNLVSNADQAMPEGGIVSVICRNVTVEDDSPLLLLPGSYVAISITDKGVGISKQHLEKVFDPYFTTKQKGSGFGLTTAYSIIKRHNGRITVDSEPGAGTTVTVYLPAVADREAKPAAPSPVKTGKGRILIMDDEEMIREIAGQILSRLGYEVAFAGEGSEAVKLYAEACEAGRPFDAVIMDLTIPGGMGGKETVKQMREIDPGVRAIVSSGYSDDPIMADYNAYGFSAVVSKPYSIKTLSDTVHHVISAGKTQSPPL